MGGTMAGNTEAPRSSFLALRILALILALLSLYNIVIPQNVAVGMSGLSVAALSGIVLPTVLRKTGDHE